jgi:hypoxanthine phosphoribosyltransferase
MKIDEIKQENIINKICFLASVLFFIGVLISCNNTGTVEPEVITSKVVGKVSDESTSGDGSFSGVENATIRLIQMENDGAEDTVSVEDVITDAQGKFISETNLDGVNNLLVKAGKDDKEWRGILTSKVKQGIAVYIQPLNMVTTVSADLFRKAVLANSNLEYTQIRILIDEDIAFILDSNSEFIDDVVSAFETGLSAEKETLLRPEIGGTTSQWEHIMSAKISAQSALDRDLYYAESVSARKIALQSYLSSIADAYVDVGMQTVTFSKVLESSSRVFLKGISGINSRLYFEFVKRSSEIRARVLDIAVQYEFQKLGADPSIINKVIDSGDELENGLEYLQSENEIAVAFINYKQKVMEHFERVTGVNGNTIAAIEDTIEVYKNDLITGVNNSGEQSAVIDAYLNFYTNVTNLVKQQISTGYIDQNAASDVLILLNMYY